MKIVVGLGNPGSTYAGTRHNVGFDVVDGLAAGARWRRGWWIKARQCALPLDGKDVLLVKPWTFMNRSGLAVAPLLRRHQLTVADLVVVVDDLDLPCGKIRVRPRGSAGGHNGLKSLIAELGSEDFVRVRVGIGRQTESRDVIDHVLSRFTAEEAPLMARGVERAAEAVRAVLRDGAAQAMNNFNG